MEKCIKVDIQRCPNADRLTVHLSVETADHLKLGKKLLSLDWVQKDYESQEVPLEMGHKGNFHFGINKESGYTWQEIIPKLQREMENYFAVQGITVKYKNLATPIRQMPFRGYH